MNQDLIVFNRSSIATLILSHACMDTLSYYYFNRDSVKSYY